jgi:hypothetical protein
MAGIQNKFHANLIFKMASGYTEAFAWGGDHNGQLGLAGKDPEKSH